MELENGMFTTDCWIVDEYITKILQPTDQVKLFFLNIDLIDDASILDDLKAL